MLKSVLNSVVLSLILSDVIRLSLGTLTVDVGIGDVVTIAYNYTFCLTYQRT